jgi:hypothetical protein
VSEMDDKNRNRKDREEKNKIKRRIKNQEE